MVVEGSGGKSVKIGDEETAEKFKRVKEFIGLKNDAEVLRFLLNKFIKEVIEKDCDVKPFIRAYKLAEEKPKNKNGNQPFTKDELQFIFQKMQDLAIAKTKLGEPCEMEDAIITKLKRLLRGEN